MEGNSRIVDVGPSSKTWTDFFSFALVILTVTFWKEAKKWRF